MKRGRGLLPGGLARRDLRTGGGMTAIHWTLAESGDRLSESPFAALSTVLGEERAREVLGGQDHYQWIYEQVLTNPAVRATNREHGLGLEQGR